MLILNGLPLKPSAVGLQALPGLECALPPGSSTAAADTTAAPGAPAQA